MSYQAYERRKKFNVIQVLYWSAVAAGLVFVVFNIRPFVSLIRFAAPGGATLPSFLAAIPLLGAVLGWIWPAVDWIIATILWFFSTVLELLPIFLRHDRALVRSVIEESGQGEEYEITADDEPTIAALKRIYNVFPAEVFAKARYYSLGAYVFEFMADAIHHPPAPSLQKFMLLIGTGQFARLDWKNIILLFVTLFAIEEIVKLLLWLGRIAFMVKRAHTTA